MQLPLLYNMLCMPTMAISITTPLGLVGVMIGMAQICTLAKLALYSLCRIQGSQVFVKIG
jgi:hypothetical protein